MSAGTITLANNSDVVAGTGTTFTTNLVTGDFVVSSVGGITYTLPVKSVDSDTQLTLISKYPGPSQTYSAWTAVPRATQNQVTAELVAQVTQALRGQNYDKANWQAVFSDSGDITVLLPDGSTFTGPSWKKIATLLENIDPAALQALADQIHTDAQQVALDRLDVDEKAAQVHADAQTASGAAGMAASANIAAQQAKTDALAAKAAAEAARDAAQQANPDNQLKKVNNLSDVQSAAESRKNIGAAGAVNLAAFIRGLDISIGASITVGVGAFALPDGSVLTVPSTITASYPTLAASTWYHLYLYNNGGTVALEVSTTAPLAYAYPAHQKTGDATRRYIGSYRVGADSAVVQGVSRGNEFFIVNDSAHPRILALGVATARTLVSFANLAPLTAISLTFESYNTATSGTVFYYSATSETAALPNAVQPVNKQTVKMPVREYPNLWYQYSATPSGGGNYIDVSGYTYAR